jgi:type I restriction enzyme S subunit
MDGVFSCYLWRGTDSWMNQRVCKFVPKENVPSTFIWFALERPLHFIESTEVATTVIHLGKGDIDEFQFIRSSHEILDQFSKLTSPFLERMVIASKEIEILAELRDTLLPKLISGCATSATMVPNDLIH